MVDPFRIVKPFREPDQTPSLVVLNDQFKCARDSGSLRAFQVASALTGFRASVLMGIFSREGWFHDYAPALTSADVRERALELSDCRRLICEKQGHRFICTSKNYPFLSWPVRGWRDLTDGELLRVTVASLDCGLWAYYHFSKGRDCDTGSTNQNYSADVLARALAFARLLKERISLPHPYTLTQLAEQLTLRF